MLLLFVSAILLQGCNSPAPIPTPNPQPQHSLKLKIIVEKSAVNRIEVQSIWVVGNIGCAPIIWPAGNPRVKQVEVPEKVENVSDDYIATIVMDRFLPDKCNWLNSGVVVNFFHDNYLLASNGVTAGALHGTKTVQVTCLTRPFVKAGGCGLRDEESLYKSEDKNAFNASMEPEK